MSSPITTELQVTGLTCNNCARKVTEAAQKIPGVHSVAVSLDTARASVRWHSAEARNVPAVLSAITQAGFAAQEIEDAHSTELRVSGMTCNNCAQHVTEAIQKLPGVRSASVALAAGRATVRWRGRPEIPAVVAAVAAAGYAAEPIEGDRDQAGERRAHWQGTLIVGLAVTGTLMAGEWIFRLALTPWFQWLAFALAGVVQVYCGAQFYRGAWRQLKVGQSNMDTLVALGSTTAFGYSAWALLAGAGGHVYFMEAAAIISLISAGHWLEARVSERAGGALKSLLNLAPQTARRIQQSAVGSQQSEAGRMNLKTLNFSQSSITNRQSSIEQEVSVADLQLNDRIALRPGDRVPVDGVVLEGESAVDEAMLTGESIPADKTAGSELFAGTLNLNGRLVMRVSATGEGTALAHIIAAVQRAQTSRADIQRLGDRISNVFVPVIVAIALAAGLWWGLAPTSATAVHDWLASFFWHVHAPAGAAAGFIIAAAVLIVACPCAMGLATPAAIMASANTAARRGILIRDGVALEKAGEVTAVIFDKTGTLTVGRPEVGRVASFLPHPGPLPPGDGTGSEHNRLSTDGSTNPVAGSRRKLETVLPLVAEEGRGDKDEMMTIAASLARHSTHPISQAIAKIADGKIQVVEWKEIRGCGIEANIQHPTSDIQHPTTKARLGSLDWLRESGVDLAAGENFIAEGSQKGATIVGLAEEMKLVGLFAVRDGLKPNAAKVVKQLQRQGLKTFLLTGDNPLTAAGIAKQVGIAAENVFAGVRPEQKADFVKRLQARGERVAFVGDGINDAPALTQADLGIAVSRASDVAREAADIILLKSEIEAVPEALGLARATLRTIKQNLFWAFFYNALGVPLAALGFISPIVCAAAMGCSDLVVIGNALRLLRWRQRG